MVKPLTVAIVLTCLLVEGCDGGGGGLSATGGGHGDASSPMTEEQVSAALTAGIVLPYRLPAGDYITSSAFNCASWSGPKPIQSR